MYKWFVLILSFFLIGCKTVGQAYSPPPPPPQGKALVYFVRGSVTNGNPFSTIFSVNNSKVVSLYDNGYSWIHLDAGTYTFSAGNIVRPNLLKIVMPISAGQEYFLEYEEAPYQAVFRPIPPDTPKSFLETYQYKEAEKAEIPNEALHNIGTENFSLDMMKQAESQKPFIKQVAEYAKSRNRDALFKAMDSSRLPRNGAKEHVDRLLNDFIFPFFKDYEKFSNQAGYSRAIVSSGGKEGLWHYMYVVTLSGEQLPFSIAVIEKDGGFRIMDIDLNKCVKNRHPVCN